MICDLFIYILVLPIHWVHYQLFQNTLRACAAVHTLAPTKVHALVLSDLTSAMIANYSSGWSKMRIAHHIGLYRDVWIAAIASSRKSLATRTAAIYVRFHGRRVRHVYVTMQITFLARKSALIYRRGLRQRVASLTIDCKWRIRDKSLFFGSKPNFPQSLICFGEYLMVSPLCLKIWSSVRCESNFRRQLAKCPTFASRKRIMAQLNTDAYRCGRWRHRWE